MDFKKIKTSPKDGVGYRKEYYDGVLSLIDRETERAALARSEGMTPGALAADPEKYRDAFCRMLGWPLSKYSHEYSPAVRKQLVETAGGLRIYRLSVETLKGLWFSGIIFEPEDKKPDAPLVFIMPGGSYRVEDLIPHGDYTCWQYRDIGARVLESGAVLFAPQLLVCSEPESGYYMDTTRSFIDAKLKALGGSIAALEIFNVRRVIDYFVANEEIDAGRIGMAGLSYGGFYTLYTAASETRIKSVFSSCFFCDRFCEREKDASPSLPGTRPDWLWQNSAHSFFDAEVAALIAPRALYIENGSTDSLFPIESVKTEYERLKPYYEAAGAGDRLMLYIGENGHEVSDNVRGFEYFMKNI
ncbi:MAG: hypothetical protein IJU01_02435 [Lachnospiraceae bacterium]|nr:hypothetical protein [Lachnospiraceae bacterium]